METLRFRDSPPGPASEQDGEETWRLGRERGQNCKKEKGETWLQSYVYRKVGGEGNRSVCNNIVYSLVRSGRTDEYTFTNIQVCIICTYVCMGVSVWCPSLLNKGSNTVDKCMNCICIQRINSIYTIYTYVQPEWAEYSLT